MITLSIKNASCGYGTKIVLSNICFNAEEGEVLCLLGPNGVGKTTLFKTILGFLKLKNGEIQVNGCSINRLSTKNKARLIGYVPQVHEPPFPYKVMDVVLMGRTAHLGAFASPGKEDEKTSLEAMQSLGIEHLAERIYTELSGGERQLVLIARALAQQPKILVMDEPTSNLDFGNQIRVLKQINRLAGQGLTVIMTSHFPNHAFLCSTKVAMINSNCLVQIGQCEDIITENNLKTMYGVDVKIARVSNGNGKTINACVPMLSN